MEELTANVSDLTTAFFAAVPYVRKNCHENQTHYQFEMLIPI